MSKKVQILEKKIEHQRNGRIDLYWENILYNNLLLYTQNSSLLRDSEATAARLSEQTGLLKTEIRRLEKNQERKENIHNLEYLKNIVFKFITLQPGTEKTGLIPVLETMLQVIFSRIFLIHFWNLFCFSLINRKKSRWCFWPKETRARKTQSQADGGLTCPDGVVYKLYGVWLCNGL